MALPPAEKKLVIDVCTNGEMPLIFHENIRRLFAASGVTAVLLVPVDALFGLAACTGDDRLRFLLVGGGLIALRRSFRLDFDFETLAVMLYFCSLAETRGEALVMWGRLYPPLCLYDYCIAVLQSAVLRSIALQDQASDNRGTILEVLPGMRYPAEVTRARRE